MSQCPGTQGGRGTGRVPKAIPPKAPTGKAPPVAPPAPPAPATSSTPAPSATPAAPTAPKAAGPKASQAYMESLGLSAAEASEVIGGEGIELGDELLAGMDDFVAPVNGPEMNWPGRCWWQRAATQGPCHLDISDVD